MRRRIAIVILLALATFLFGQEMTTAERWGLLTEDQKEVYATGVLHGMYLPLFILEDIRDLDRIADQHPWEPLQWQTMLNSVEILINEAIFSRNGRQIPVQELVGRIDAFYLRESNRDRPLQVAIYDAIAGAFVEQ